MPPVFLRNSVARPAAGARSAPAAGSQQASGWPLFGITGESKPRTLPTCSRPGGGGRKAFQNTWAVFGNVLQGFWGGTRGYLGGRRLRRAPTGRPEHRRSAPRPEFIRPPAFLHTLFQASEPVEGLLITNENARCLAPGSAAWGDLWEGLLITVENATCAEKHQQNAMEMRRKR